MNTPTFLSSSLNTHRKSGLGRIPYPPLIKVWHLIRLNTMTTGGCVDVLVFCHGKGDDLTTNG